MKKNLLVLPDGKVVSVADETEFGTVVSVLGEEQVEGASEKEIDLVEGKIYCLSKEEAPQYPPFGIIKENRSGDKRAKHWLGILQDVGMAGHATVVPARIVKDAGLTPLMWDRTKKAFVEVPEKYLDKLYVLEDGHGRYAAYLRALFGNLQLFDFFFIFKNYDDPAVFKKQYISMNKDAQRTSSREVAGLYYSDSTSKMFKNYMEDVNVSRYIPKAAQIKNFAKELKHADYDKFASNQEVNVDEVLVECIEECYTAYEKAFKKYAPKLLHGTELAFFTKEALLSVSAENMDDVKDTIVKKFSKLLVEDLTTLNEAKKEGNRTRGQVIKDTLKDILNKEQ